MLMNEIGTLKSELDLPKTQLKLRMDLMEGTLKNHSRFNKENYKTNLKVVIDVSFNAGQKSVKRCVF